MKHRVSWLIMALSLAGAACTADPAAPSVDDDGGPDDDTAHVADAADDAAEMDIETGTDGDTTAADTGPTDADDESADVEAPDYVLSLTYEGPVPIDRFEVFFFDTVRECSTLEPVADRQVSEDGVVLVVDVAAEADSVVSQQGVSWTSGGRGPSYAVARGQPAGADGYFVAWGCADGIGQPGGEEPRAVDITLQDLMPETRGTYAVTVALPPNLLPSVTGPMTARLGQFLEDPALAIMELLANTGEETYWDTGPYDAIFDLCTGPGTSTEGSNPRCGWAGQVATTNLGANAAAAVEVYLDSGVAGLGDSDTLAGALARGADLVEGIEGYALSGALGVSENPTSEGDLGDGVTLELNKMIWTWADSERAVILSEEEYVHGDGVEGTVGFGAVGAAAPWYGARLTSVGLELDYADVISVLLERVLLPLLVDESIHSVEQLLNALIDCEELALLYEDELGFGGSYTEALCDTLLTAVSATTALRTWLTQGLDVTTTYLQLASPSSPLCPIALQDDDEGPQFVTVTFGGTDADASCPLEGTVAATAEDTEREDASAAWWAIRL